MVLILLVLGAALAETVRGTVTLAGEPVPLAMVIAQGGGVSVDVQAGLDGRFVIDAPDGGRVFARTDYLDGEGHERTLRAPPIPAAAAVTLALAELQGPDGYVALDAAALSEAATHARLDPERLIAVRASVDAVLAAKNTKERRKIIARDAAILGWHDGRVLRRMLIPQSKAARDQASLQAIGDVVLDCGIGLGLEWLRANGMEAHGVGLVLGGDPAGGIARLVEAEGVLEAAIARATPGDRHNLTQQRASILATHAQVLLFFAKDIEGAIPVFERALELARSSGAAKTRADAALGLGLALVEVGRPAPDLLREAAEVYGGLGVHESRGTALDTLSLYVEGAEKVEVSLAAAAAWTDHGDPAQAAASRIRAAIAAGDAAALDAERAVLASLPAGPTRDDALARACRELALLKREADPALAERLLREALALDAGDDWDVAIDRLELAETLVGRDRGAEALEVARAAQRDWDTIGAARSGPRLRWRAAMAVGNAHQDLADLRAAAAAFEQALAIATADGLEPEIADARWAAGYALFDVGVAAGEVRDAEAVDATIEHLRAARQAYRRLDRPEDRALAASFLGLALQARGNLRTTEARDADALVDLDEALAIADEEGDRAQRASVQGMRGLVLGNLGRFEEAIPAVEEEIAWLRTPEALASWRETTAGVDRATAASVRPDVQLAASLGVLPGLYRGAGRTDAVWPALEQHRRALEALGEADRVFESLLTEATFRAMAGDVSGLGRAVSMLDRKARGDDQRALVLPYRVLAPALRGDFDGFDRAHTEARAWLASREKAAAGAEGDVRRRYSVAFGAMAQLDQLFGRPREALRTYEIALTLAEGDDRTVVLQSIARAAADAGELQRALDTLAMVAGSPELTRGLPPSERIGMLLETEAIQRRLGESAAADATLAQAREEAKPLLGRPELAPMDRVALATLHGVEGDRLLAAGRHADAEAAYAQAFQRYGDWTDERALGFRVRRLETAVALGRGDVAEVRAIVPIAIGLGAWDAVAELVDVAAFVGAKDRDWLLGQVAVARGRAADAGALHALPVLDAARGRMLARAGAPKAAIEAWLQAMDELDLLRGEIRSDRAKVGYLDAREGRLFDDAVALLVDQGRIEEALVVSERSRARAFQDLLATEAVERALSTDPDGAEALALLDRIGALSSARSVDLGALIDDRDATVALPDPSESIAAARARLEALREGSTGEVVSLVSARTLTAAGIRDVARSSGSTLVAYHLGEARSFAFVVTPDGQIRAETLPIGVDALDQLVTEARSQMGVEIGRGAKAMGRRPVDQRPGEALARLHAAVVAPLGALPEGTVTIVPHGSLFLVPFAALPDVSGRALAERHPIATTPAVGVLAFTEARRPGDGPAVVVGNPAMPVVDGAPLPALPGAESEARALAAGLGGRALFGADATEAAVRQAVGGARIVHLATHGVVDDADPLASFVALAPADGDDGRLTVEEVFGLRLNADLVALSACQTGLGRVSGDGVMGLGRAFLFAGTPSVLVSLWSVSDEATAFQMGVFYAKLGEGLDKAAALRAAQLATRERWPDPAMWSAFVLVGSD